LSVSVPVVFSRRANYEYDSYFERYPFCWVFSNIFSETRSISANRYAGVSQDGPLTKVLIPNIVHR